MLVEKCSTWWLGWLVGWLGWLGWLVGWLGRLVGLVGWLVGLVWFGFTKMVDVNARFQNMSRHSVNTCFKKVHLHPKPTRRINVLIP